MISDEISGLVPGEETLFIPGFAIDQRCLSIYIRAVEPCDIFSVIYGLSSDTIMALLQFKLPKEGSYR